MLPTKGCQVLPPCVIIFAVYIDPNCNCWNINQIVFQKDSLHKKEIYFLFTVHIYTNIMWKMCNLWTFIESSTILHIVMGHYKPTQHIYIKHSLGRCFFCLFGEERAVFVSFLGKMKRNREITHTLIKVITKLEGQISIYMQTKQLGNKNRPEGDWGVHLT